MDQSELIGLLAGALASGKLDFHHVLHALREIVEEREGDHSTARLLEALEEYDGPAVGTLVKHLRRIRHGDALSCHRLKVSGESIPDELRASLGDLPLDAPLGWKTPEELLAPVRVALSVLRDRLFVRSRDAPRTASTIEERFQEAVAATREAPGAWGLLVPLRLVRGALHRAGREPAELVEALERLKDELEREGEGASRPESPNEARELIAARLPPGRDETEVLEALARLLEKADGREDRKQLIDLLCSWPTTRVVPFILDHLREAWEQDRAGMVFRLRFGQATGSLQPGQSAWSPWLLQTKRELESELADVESFLRPHAGELLLLWCCGEEGLDPGTLATLEAWCREEAPPTAPDAFVERWAEVIPAEEWSALSQVDGAPVRRVVPPPVPRPDEAVASAPAPTGDVAAEATPPAPPPSLTGPAVADVTAPTAREQAVEPASVEPASVDAPVAVPTVPREDEEKVRFKAPALWTEHIQPFFVENWYMVAGIVMVIAGSSLLAYYTWDKHWLVRYSIMPALLAAFTGALGGVGRWIEKRDVELRASAATLRGAAIGLLPINFMTVALLSNDAQVSQKAIAVPVMGAVYLIIGGRMLTWWCSAVHRSLGWLLGGTLLLLNCLVILGPLARAGRDLSEQQLLVLLGTGFHLGFLVLAAAVVRFTRHVLTRELAEEKIVPWFLGATLSITFLQVFFWVHLSLRHVPQVYTYAPMIILTGWLVLFLERRALELRGAARTHGAESFLGFALVLLGVLMAAAHPYLRIVGFLLAGAVWLRQALARRHPAHYWIALSFLVLGGASAGLLEAFPGRWLPALGLGLAVLLGGLGRLGRVRSEAELRDAATGMQAAVLAIAVLVAMLAQWHYRSPALLTAGFLIAALLGFAWRAYRDRRLRWVFTAAVTAALALPYLGFADVEGRTLEGNTVVFGLALLSLIWIGLARAKMPLVREARSTALWFYGALAVTAMILRVLFERATPVEPRWLDYAGPLLMTAVLALTTYYSRSLVPAGMAVVIAVILFPELKATVDAAFENLRLGSGLGSAASALVLICASFYLRSAPFLEKLEDGDRFLGRDPFPLRRSDHTLFTWPLLAATIFLIVKVDTWTLLREVVRGESLLKTATAVAITGVVWTLVAVYHRADRRAALCTHLGWFWILAGVAVGYRELADDPPWTRTALVASLALQGLYFIHRLLIEPRREWARDILTRPTHHVLNYGSIGLSVVCALALAAGEDAIVMTPLALFLAAQLVWHGLAVRTLTYGTLLFLLACTWLLAWTAPGSGVLLERLSVEESVTPILWFLLTVQVVHVALELRRETHEVLSPVLVPILFGASLVAALLSVPAVLEMLGPARASWPQLLLLLVVLVLTARTHASGPVLLLGAALGYVMVHRGAFGDLPRLDDRILLLASPWHVSLLALALSVIGQAGRLVGARHPAWLAGPFRLAFFTFPSIAWMFVPAAICASLAALYHTVHPVLREEPIQLWAPFLGAGALGLVAWSWKRSALAWGSAALLMLANIHAARVSVGELLRGNGLSEIHLLALGLAATLLEASALRLALRRVEVLTFLNRASLVTAGLVLALLAVNYFVHPSLDAISTLRFVVSGSMAYLAGLYFRRASRHPGAGEEAQERWWEGTYHFAVTLTIWCAALLVPQLRHPATALLALGVPVVYFYARAELGTRMALQAARGYRDSASVLGFAILALYAARGLFQMILFPEAPIRLAHYHDNAPLVMALAVVLLRLRGLGGTPWLAFHGGLALMAGSFFSLTTLPGLSPFSNPVPAAWCAVGLGHFWILVSATRSPLRTAIARLGALDGKEWHALRRSWGLCLLVATQAAVAWGLLDYASSPYMFAPLLAGAASILIHQGALRTAPARGVYFLVAGTEILLALHADFLVPSYIDRDLVLWIILAGWAGFVLAPGVTPGRIAPQNAGRVVAVLALLTLGHVIDRHPSSPAGLWGFALGALLAAWTPRRDRSATSLEALAPAGALLLVPTWLVYFGQAPLREEGLAGAANTWAVLITVATVFLTGCFGAVFQERLASRYTQTTRDPPRLFDHTLSLLGSAGAMVHIAVLCVALAAAALIQTLHHASAFEPRELLLLLGLYAALAAAWFREGRTRDAMAPYIIAQMCVLGLFLAIRRHLTLTTDFWTYEYDVWTSLAVSVCLSGAKQVWERESRAMRMPFLGTLFALPVVAVGWVLLHGLGSNAALLVVGVHTLMFAYMGRGERESPYNVIAIAAFVAFVLLVFWTKLELRVLHAYVVPVGLAILVLLQMFGSRMQPRARNEVRLVTLLAMLGSAGYYALVDDRYPLAFPLTFGALSLLAMGLGGFFRVRLYLTLGMGGVVVDLAAIFYRVLVQMERGPRMTVVGSTVLLIGASLVFGAIYYKTHKEAIGRRIDEWRKRLHEWE